MNVPVMNIDPGKVIAYRGEPCIVLEHRREGTLLLGVEWVKHPFGSSNNFAASSLRTHLNSVYLDTLTQGHPDEVITRMRSSPGRWTSPPSTAPRSTAPVRPRWPR